MSPRINPFNYEELCGLRARLDWCVDRKGFVDSGSARRDARFCSRARLGSCGGILLTIAIKAILREHHATLASVVGNLDDSNAGLPLANRRLERLCNNLVQRARVSRSSPQPYASGDLPYC